MTSIGKILQYLIQIRIFLLTQTDIVSLMEPDHVYNRRNDDQVYESCMIRQLCCIVSQFGYLVTNNKTNNKMCQIDTK